jgi:hypothetical protein
MQYGRIASLIADAATYLERLTGVFVSRRDRQYAVDVETERDFGGLCATYAWRHALNREVAKVGTVHFASAAAGRAGLGENRCPASS